MTCNHEYTNQEGRNLEKQIVMLEKKLADANDQIIQLKDRLKMYKDGLCMPIGEITHQYISDFLRTLPTGSIWYFIACKWDAMMMQTNKLK